jgi:GDP-L-fucose synthase
MNKNQSIALFGYTGLIGSAILRVFREAGYANIYTPRSGELDLTNYLLVEDFFQKNKPDYVILAAGLVGGIFHNQQFPADFIEKNVFIHANVLKCARAHGVKKTILFGSSCMYPRDCPQPMAEDSLLTGLPEITSLPYAMSKLTAISIASAYNRQIGENRFLSLIPNSVYGPNDNFSFESGHVLSALMARFHDAVKNNVNEINLWGTGVPKREFVYVDDVARACLMLLSLDVRDLEFPLNLGVGYDLSISELADKIAFHVGYFGKITWDASKPDGVMQKLLDSSVIRSIGWDPKVNLDDGLSMTYSWYQDYVSSISRVS